MSQSLSIPVTKTKTTASGWETLYQLGGIAALVIILVSLLDIIITFFPWGATPDPGKGTVIDWFRLIQANWFLGLRGLGLLNLLSTALAVPVFLALYLAGQPASDQLEAHRRQNQAYAALATLILCIGVTSYIANNSALSMLALSNRYGLATTEAQRSQLVAAGQVLLVQAEDFSPGAFAGFFFTEIAYLLMAAVLLRSRFFGKAGAWVGLTGFLLMLVSTTWATFIPVFYDATVLLAMFGGLFCMAWFFLVARRLFQLGRPVR
jgi:hypothetical protein